jgi:small-conductance mechanosensitive channel
MRTRRWLLGTALALLLAAVLAGLLWTRERAAPPAAAGESATDATSTRRPGQRLVNMQPLLTARRMAALAQTPEEQELARQAVRIADHVVDLALAESIRRIAEEPAPPTPEIRALIAAREKAQAALEAARQRVQALTSQIAGARGEDQQRLEDLRSLAQAQHELAQDDLDAAAERLARAGGDPQALIRRLRAAYEAAQSEQVSAPAVAASGGTGGSLLSRLRSWRAQRGKQAGLEAARQEALARAEALTARIDRVSKRIQEGQGAVEAARQDPATALPQAAPAAGKESTIASLQDAARDRRRLTGLGKRLEDQQELAEVYGEWVGRVDAQVRAALRQVLLSALWLLAVGAAALAAGWLIDRAFPADAGPEARAGTVRMLARLAVQVACLAAALFVTFGAPGQATTILGLAGAGLTVALKDFIVAFFGWFVLMGRNGIRVGDWVEIQGVGGEVAEIGLFHTVLLETGSWGDAGHPTGRRVSFVNSFAIERHYFNFSTSGQWMWDELRVVVPPGKDPYPIIDGIQKLVERETQANAELAEQEWRNTTTRYRVRTFSAVPGINVVPTAGGVELDVRFITRAYERHGTRRRLSHAIVELMHGRRNEPGPGADAA